MASAAKAASLAETNWKEAWRLCADSALERFRNEQDLVLQRFLVEQERIVNELFKRQVQYGVPVLSTEGQGETEDEMQASENSRETHGTCSSAAKSSWSNVEDVAMPATIGDDADLISELRRVEIEKERRDGHNGEAGIEAKERDGVANDASGYRPTGPCPMASALFRASTSRTQDLGEGSDYLNESASMFRDDGFTGTVSKFVTKANLPKRRRTKLDGKVVRLVRLTSHVHGIDFETRIEGLVSWWSSLQEPKRTTLTARFITNSSFEFVCVSVILFNSAWIWYTTDLAASTRSSAPLASARIMELVFLTYYCLELLLKIYVHRLFFFVNDHAPWNVFDFCLVFASLLETFVIPWFEEHQGAAGNVDIKFLRTVRLLKLAKVLRMIRVLQFISNLRLFLACLVGCGPSLFWAVVIIIMILVLFSMFLVQAMTMHVLENGDAMDETTLAGIEELFGSVATAAITLFQCVTGGKNWDHPFEIVRATGTLNASVFVFFVFFTVIAVWNIVTSIFIERTRDIAQPDLDDLMLAKRRRDLEDGKKLLTLCQMIDSNNDNTISLEELQSFMDNEEFRQYFTVRGIDIKDADLFFSMLMAASEEQGEAVGLETFIGGCLRLKGFASAIDVQTLAFESKLMHCMQKRFFVFAERRLIAMEEEMQNLQLQLSAKGRVVPPQVLTPAVASSPARSFRRSSTPPPSTLAAGSRRASRREADLVLTTVERAPRSRSQNPSDSSSTASSTAKADLVLTTVERAPRSRSKEPSECSARQSSVATAQEKDHPGTTDTNGCVPSAAGGTRAVQMQEL
eukprot:TRINITY_DN24902_c0_g1_i1.p1 TRINITY_DN24902_c0_g1~~TRINITY_DN24902_c0_g1_i1.p1  ORF type:complete len:802 (+),score=91.93 TRINITY_DN24902_c0_g1_i1:175-2580(+)